MPVNIEITLNGVHYALSTLAGRIYRVGSLTADWRRMVGDNPDNQANLAAQGIWISPEPEQRPQAGVMCCGLGSVWPGMGRALYDNFPVSRAAMNRIAALADWDVLGLMAETDLTRISQTRWQIPYLFLLEYAQWCQFRSLGLTPRLVCGHSLGELLGLCISGIYSLESLWYLLETRAAHMAELEAGGGREGGMLAVPAQWETVQAVLQEWPQLRISNRNTQRQYILSGPRELLLKARKHLRKDHIPAVMLNMDLAFHNPAMRILRTLSQRRLNGLQALSAQFPLLSCVDSQPYPQEGGAISRRIADLDENMVDWVHLLETIDNSYPCSAFLELGPQETLCGITAEGLPHISCIPADKRGHEAVAMRAACARLFAGGFLELDAIKAQAARRVSLPEPLPDPPPLPPPALEGIAEKEIAIIMQILGEACQIPPEHIRPEMDLRQDLNIRSSTFPFLMLEAERRLGRPVALENLFQITTAADLVIFLADKSPQASPANPGSPGEDRRFLDSRRLIGRFAFVEGELQCCPLDPLANGLGQRLPFRLRSLDDDLNRLAAQIPLNRFIVKDESPATGQTGLVLTLPPEGGSPLSPLPPDIAWLCVLKRFPKEAAPTQIQQWFAEIRNYAGDVPLKIIAWLAPRDILQVLQDCADLLMLELYRAPAGEIVWRGERCQRFCKDSRIFQQIALDPLPPRQAVGTLFQGMFHLSEYADAACGENSLPGLPPRSVPPGKLLQMAAAAGETILPSLRPIGFTDLRMVNLPVIPAGVTRECRIASQSRFALMYEGVMTRICNMEMAAAAIGPHNRKNGGWEPVCAVSCLMGCDFAPIPPIWETGGSGKMQANGAELEAFYDKWQIGGQWRLLETIAAADLICAGENIPGYEASARSGPVSGTIWQLLDAVFQAALWTLISEYCFSSPVFANMGFVRFNRQIADDWAACRIQWRISWQDKSLTRFDAQICAGDGSLLATVLNLEFNCGSPVGDSKNGA